MPTFARTLNPNPKPNRMTGLILPLDHVSGTTYQLNNKKMMLKYSSGRLWQRVSGGYQELMESIERLMEGRVPGCFRNELPEAGGYIPPEYPES